MSGPDGLEQRTAELEESAWDNEYEITDEDRTEAESLLDLAEARMTSHFIDKILENG